jgi:hypothetical protein
MLKTVIYCFFEETENQEGLDMECDLGKGMQLCDGIWQKICYSSSNQTVNS